MALIIPTNKCDLRCSHCMREEYKGKALDLTILKNFLSDLAKLGENKRHSVTGGEPTYYPDLEGFFSIFRELKMTLGMATNGQNMKGVETAIKYKDVVTTVAISIEGPSAEINDKIRGEGTFNKAVEAIKMYLKEGITVKLHTVLFDDNVDSIKDMFILANSLGVKFINFSTLHPVKKILDSDLVVTSEKLEEARIIRRKEARKYPNIKSGITTRHMLSYTEPEWKEEWCQPSRGKIENGITLTPNGKVSLCCDLINLDFCKSRYNGKNEQLNHVLGDYTKEPLDTILKNKKLLMDKLRQRRTEDSKNNLLVGPRQYICENCKFYFNS